MAKEGITGKANILEHYKKICEIVDGDVSAEVVATEFDKMVEEGEELAKLHDQIVVKIPMIKDGVKAIKYFSDNGIRTNCTLVFFRLDRHCLRLKPVRPTFPRFWADSTTFQQMAYS